MTNSLDPDQAQRFVGPDLGPNSLPRLSADDTGRQRVNHLHSMVVQPGLCQTRVETLKTGFLAMQLTLPQKTEIKLFLHV